MDGSEIKQGSGFARPRDEGRVLWQIVGCCLFGACAAISLEFCILVGLSSLGRGSRDIETGVIVGSMRAMAVAVILMCSGPFVLALGGLLGFRASKAMGRTSSSVIAFAGYLPCLVGIAWMIGIL